MATFAYPAGVSSSSSIGQVSLSYSGKVFITTTKKISAVPYILAYQRRWGTQLTYLFWTQNTTITSSPNIVTSLAGIITSSSGTINTPTTLVGASGGMVQVPISTSNNDNVIFNKNIAGNVGYEVLTYPGNRELTFGVITSDKSLQLTIYNKRLDSISLASHNVPAEFGCEITGMAVGEAIPALGQTTINIKAKLLSGDSEVAAFCPIYFDKVTIWVYVTISRQPVVIYSLYPDRNSYSESYSCKTNVFATTSGKERRMSIMVSPKTKVKYQITSNTASMASFFENIVYSGLYSEMYQPLWAFASKTTTSISAQTAVPCNTYNDIFIPGNYVVIYTTEVEATLSKIVSVTPTTINVLKPVSAASGAWVVPVSLMIPTKSTGSSYKSSSGQSHNISLQEYS